MNVAKVTGMAYGTPSFGYEINILNSPPREYYDEIRGDDDSGMLGEYGEAFQLGFTAAVRHVQKLVNINGKKDAGVGWGENFGENR